jgi:hypothetical protein
VSYNDGGSSDSHVYALPFSHSSTVTLPKSVTLTVEGMRDGPSQFDGPPVLTCRILRGGTVVAQNRGQGYASCSASLN